MKTSENLNELAAALVKSQRDFPMIPKNKTAKVPTKNGQNYTYKYADLADIISITTPVLTENGLSVFQATSILDKDTAILETTILHVSGQFITSAFPVKMYERPQETGSEMTYMRRYTLTATLGIHGDEDEDGEGANNNGTSRASLTDKKPISAVNVTHVGSAIIQPMSNKINVEPVIKTNFDKTKTETDTVANLYVKDPAKSKTKATEKQIKLIFAKLKGLKLNDDEMKELIVSVTGKEHSSEFDYGDIDILLTRISSIANASNDGQV